MKTIKEIDIKAIDQNGNLCFQIEEMKEMEAINYYFKYANVEERAGNKSYNQAIEIGRAIRGEK